MREKEYKRVFRYVCLFNIFFFRLSDGKTIFIFPQTKTYQASNEFQNKEKTCDGLTCSVNLCSIRKGWQKKFNYASLMSCKWPIILYFPYVPRVNEDVIDAVTDYLSPPMRLYKGGRAQTDAHKSVAMTTAYLGSKDTTFKYVSCTFSVFYLTLLIFHENHWDIFSAVSKSPRVAKHYFFPFQPLCLTLEVETCIIKWVAKRVQDRWSRHFCRSSSYEKCR